MEFKQLEAFVAVVEYNSFSEAARHLFLTQPTVSAHIRSLEQELNSKLIIRTTKKLTITRRGHQLYDCAVNMLNMRNSLIEEFTGQDKRSLTWECLPFLPPIFFRRFSAHSDIRFPMCIFIPGSLTARVLSQECLTGVWI